MLLLEQQFARILNIFIFQFAPFVLVPSSFPRKEFEKAVALQPIINRLMHNVAHDEEFITTTLAETIKVDEFTANLFNIYRKVLAHGFTQVRFRQLASIHLRSSALCTPSSYHPPTYPPHSHREGAHLQAASGLLARIYWAPPPAVAI